MVVRVSLLVDLVENYKVYLYPNSYKKVTNFGNQTYPNRHGPRRLQVLQYQLCRLVLLNFEMILYFLKWKR
jgi:hypothetical protein